MLKDIYIKDFKNVDEFHLALRPLTLLFGTNGSGKTTVIKRIITTQKKCNNQVTYIQPDQGHFDFIYAGLYELKSNKQLNFWFSILLPTSNKLSSRLSSSERQVLNILRNSLKATELICLENPECFLHGFTQSKLCEFLTFLLDSGIQIIIETQSEQILNGLRCQIKNELISHKDVMIYFFNHIQVEEIMVDRYGNIHNWPLYFFDQNDKDFQVLFGF